MPEFWFVLNGVRQQNEGRQESPKSELPVFDYYAEDVGPQKALTKSQFPSGSLEQEGFRKLNPLEEASSTTQQPNMWVAQGQRDFTP